VTQLAQAALKLDAVAWKFVGSEFAGQTYADWPIERRLDVGATDDTQEPRC
jgi:hypothetical protein